MFEWLKDYRRLEDEISLIEFNLDRSERELKRWVSGDLVGVRLNSDSDGANLEETIESIQYELANKMNDLHDVQKLIATFRGLENQILYGKYVEGKTLLDVAFHLDKSPNYIYNKHAQIMRMIDYAHNL
ncbi:hypothetical protein [Sporosarcina sp. A2]|uniref:hypothetical protein n=1 Tax=Sporosarcina sp. A2 TaxID=3393449 RepID=UPI003D79E679